MLNFSLWEWKHNEIKHSGLGGGGGYTMASQVPVFQNIDFKWTSLYMCLLTVCIISSDFTKICLA
jgi:hypothetical protein